MNLIALTAFYTKVFLKGIFKINKSTEMFLFFYNVKFNYRIWNKYAVFGKTSKCTYADSALRKMEFRF